MKILINCTGFIGDILFSSSIAKKLKEENPDIIVDYLIHLYQPYELLQNNPFIDNVYLFNCDTNNYDKIINLSYIDFNFQPALYYQMLAGIKNPSPEFYVYTNPAYDYVVSKNLKPYKDDNKIIIAYLSNWEERSFLFTEKEYNIGIDVPNLGYGGKHRDINKILFELNKNPNLILIPVGMPAGYNVREADFNNTSEYSMQASFIKCCDYFIGAEGGLANLACGVGTKTILTGDFVHQLYGWNGSIRKHQQPKLGPIWYFPYNNYELDPYLTDIEVATNINLIINKTL